jgi:CubicO group peptidase (beta-lactamase class C family)
VITDIPYICTRCYLPPELEDQLLHLTDEAIRARVFTGIGLAVMQRGEWRYQGLRGWLDRKINVPLPPDALFDLASITKLFTTTAFLALVSAGKTTLDTPLVAVIPEFGSITPRPIDGGQDPHSKALLPTQPELTGQTVDPAKVTFRHLLTHTSGLPPWRDVYLLAGPVPTPPDIPDGHLPGQRWQNALAALCNYPFVASPDGIVRYSDIGLMLLGEAVSRLHGTPGNLEAAIQARVLTPLKLDDVMFNPVRSGRVPRGRVIPTELDETWRQRRAWGEVHDENACGVGGIAGHAGLFASARSVALFGQAWLKTPTETFGIAPELAAEAKREQVISDGQRRGLGFVLKAHRDSSVGDLFSADTFGHTGFTGTTLWIDPQYELVIALMTNRVYYGRESDAIHHFRRNIHTALAKYLQ